MPETKTTIDKTAIAERRKKVWEFVQRGIAKSAIAKILNVHINTVYADLKIFRKDRCDYLENFDKKTEVGLLISQYDMLFQSSMSDYHLADTPGAKSKFLSRASQLLVSKQNLLLETGLIEDVIGDASDLTDSGEDMKEMAIDDLMSYLVGKAKSMEIRHPNIVSLQQGVNDEFEDKTGVASS